MLVVKENRYDVEKYGTISGNVGLISIQSSDVVAIVYNQVYTLFSTMTKEVLSEYMPEMHRVPLHEMVLQIKVLDLLDGDAMTFLVKLLHHQMKRQ